MIKVDSLSRSYNKVNAVNNVSFEILDREIIGLLGHNGAGKTTILKMLTGFLEPSAGTVTINGRDVCAERQKIQSEIGYLPENSPVYPDMIVLDYLHYAASLHGVPAEKTEERILYAIQKTRVADVALKQISTLSRGYKQRLGVAQAILNSPNILILDEPTNGLDPTQIMEMRALIKELAETATVIISTHILQEVRAICGRVIIINRGQIALDANLDSIQVSNKLIVSTDRNLQNETKLLQDLKLQIVDQHEKDTQHIHTLQAEGQKSLVDITPELVRSLVESGARIYAVHPIERDLETVFKEISSGIAVQLEKPGAAVAAAQPQSPANTAQSESEQKQTVPASAKDGNSSEKH